MSIDIAYQKVKLRKLFDSIDILTQSNNEPAKEEMETINQSLLTTNLSTTLSISHKGKQIHSVNCEVRFVFMILKKKEVLGYLFLPDYEPILNQSATSLTLKPKHEQQNLSTIVFFNLSTAILDLLYQYIPNSSVMLSGAYEWFVDEMKFPFEQDIGTIDHPYVLKVSSEFKFMIYDSNSSIFSYQLTPNTSIVTTDFNENPMLGFFESDSQKDIKFTIIPDLNSLFRWMVFLRCCTNYISSNKTGNESNQVEDENLSEESQTPELIVDDIQFEYLSNSNESNLRKSSFESDSFPNYHLRSDRKLSCDLQIINNLALDVEKKKKQLADLKSNYVKTISIPEPIPEPAIPPPVVANIQDKNRHSYEPVKMVKKEEKLTCEQFAQIIEPRIHHPLVNFYRYIPDYFNLSLQIPGESVDFIPEDNCPESFENLFYYSTGIKQSESIFETENGDPALTFLLLCSILTNGYKKSSLSELYEISPKKGEKLKDEVYLIMNKYQDKIFEFILSFSDQKLQDNYESWSILISRKDIIQRINQIIINKASPVIKFSQESPTSDVIPFLFPFKPFHSIQNWFFNLLYIRNFKTIDTRDVMIQLSAVLWGLFNHYLKFSLTSNIPIKANEIIMSNVSLYTFIKEIMSRINTITKNIPPWSLLKKQQDFYNAWIEFWAISFQQDKLVMNFTEFFQYPDLIRKYYYPCSGMRHQTYIKFSAEVLHAASQLKLSKDFDANFRSPQSDIKILKNLTDKIKLR